MSKVMREVAELVAIEHLGENSAGRSPRAARCVRFVVRGVFWDAHSVRVRAPVQHGCVGPAPSATQRFWKVVNPLTRPFAGYAPWWVLLETIGRRTGRPRHTPLAGAPSDGSALSVLSVYGEGSAFVKNIQANPDVRIQRRGRWLTGTAELLDPTPETTAQLGRYARLMLLRIASKPKVVRVTFN